MIYRFMSKTIHGILSHTKNLSRCMCISVPEHFVQGQSPKEGLREYFYYIDHQGQLFLEGTKIQNFTTCFKDKKFMIFFFKRLRRNNTERYKKDFPFISRCGSEMNYIRCESLPIVFTDIIDNENIKGDGNIVMNGIGEGMTLPFQPEQLCMLPRNGRVYHPAPRKVGGAGILKTSLAIDFSSYFLFENGDDEIDPPSHFVWKDVKYVLSNDLWKVMKHMNVEEDED